MSVKVRQDQGPQHDCESNATFHLAGDRYTFEGEAAPADMLCKTQRGGKLTDDAAARPDGPPWLAVPPVAGRNLLALVASIWSAMVIEKTNVFRLSKAAKPFSYFASIRSARFGKSSDR